MDASFRGKSVPQSSMNGRNPVGRGNEAEDLEKNGDSLTGKDSLSVYTRILRDLRKRAFLGGHINCLRSEGEGKGVSEERRGSERSLLLWKN